MVYANGELYDQLEEIDYVIPLHEETDDAMLRNLKHKLGDDYAVYLIKEGLGDRGEDFRAEDHPLGIALLILGTFTDARSRT